ncbi:hypothetical protein [Jeongeupia sp. USM3]|uniref:hypothetical protein n=1 Tax=Jeongeupia sp. USM3 TaxID=1906741 RepID=UPI00089DE906|nr:hypothetical protein [Jeongeupia sp. USM3]AOY00246.1 hypothetical protein BJP62_07180 [Jeongeupia sp. USM3]
MTRTALLLLALFATGHASAGETAASFVRNGYDVVQADAQYVRLYNHDTGACAIEERASGTVTPTGAADCTPYITDAKRKYWRTLDAGRQTASEDANDDSRKREMLDSMIGQKSSLVEDALAQSGFENIGGHRWYNASAHKYVTMRVRNGRVVSLY